MRKRIKKITEDGAEGFLEELLIPGLALASKGYAAACGLRNWALEKGWLTRKKLPIPVVSVGNITWGGTGKTPFVKMLARKFAAGNKKVLILMRGYSHDETAELEASCPAAVLGVGKNRYQTALKKMGNASFDIVLLDDGFQHTQLERDVDIVLINAKQPFGNGHLIPWGNLREPLELLVRAHFIVLTHSADVPRDSQQAIRNTLGRYAPQAEIVEAEHVPGRLFRAKEKTELGAEFLNRRDVLALSGIGYPESFRELLTAQGARIQQSMEFRDHHNFDFKDLEEARRLKEKGLVQDIVVTEKDYRRSPELLTEMLNPLVLCVQLKITSGEPVLDDRLYRLLAR
ncbi:MAG: tetraacyldisaccharide 4'-kinase [Candidatus Omnitrophica bacterium]|nr:tetraacyldisaccharide 4'-kinase [Candidatus Omnitrophota bacterium]